MKMGKWVAWAFVLALSFPVWGEEEKALELPEARELILETELPTGNLTNDMKPVTRYVAAVNAIKAKKIPTDSEKQALSEFMTVRNTYLMLKHGCFIMQEFKKQPPENSTIPENQKAELAACIESLEEWLAAAREAAVPVRIMSATERTAAIEFVKEVKDVLERKEYMKFTQAYAYLVDSEKEEHNYELIVSENVRQESKSLIQLASAVIEDCSNAYITSEGVWLLVCLRKDAPNLERTFFEVVDDKGKRRIHPRGVVFPEEKLIGLPVK